MGLHGDKAAFSTHIVYRCYMYMYMITYIVGPYQRAPGGVTLTDVSQGKLTFSWTQIDPNCPTVQYQIMSDCGNCSTTNTSATCSNLSLSTTERNCTFSVGSVICGFTGPSSNPITVTLKGMIIIIRYFECTIDYFIIIINHSSRSSSSQPYTCVFQ